jgi:hypothetical protein
MMLCPRQYLKDRLQQLQPPPPPPFRLPFYVSASSQAWEQQVVELCAKRRASEEEVAHVDHPQGEAPHQGRHQEVGGHHLPTQTVEGWVS